MTQKYKIGSRLEFWGCQRPCCMTHELIWLHVRGGGDREWRQICFTGVTTLLRFLEAKKWDFVCLVIVWKARHAANLMRSKRSAPVLKIRLKISERI